jgi:hypothetical protein
MAASGVVTKWLVGAHSGDHLAVVPLDTAVRDVQLIKHVTDLKTFADVRRSNFVRPMVRELCADRVAAGTGAAFDDVPDNTPFDYYEWIDFFWRPDVRLRTAQLAPTDLLTTFGREDHGYGIDYTPATWFSTEDRDQIEAALRQRGDEIVHDDQLVEGYFR